MVITKGINMEIFAISDTHFGHKNIIKLVNRPFKNVDEMDIALIDNWNSVVSENDEVWFLGDFAWYKEQDNYDYVFNSLNGRKNLVKGNHDNEDCLYLPWNGIYVRAEMMFYNKKFVLDHYPLEDWNGRFKDSIHLHGHIHNATHRTNIPNRYNVSVEAINYKPKNVKEFL